MTPSRRSFLLNSLGLWAWLQQLNGGALATDLGSRSKSALKNIVVILRENHSFDNYFGSYPAANGKVLGERCSDAQADPPHTWKYAARGASTTIEGKCHYLEEDIPDYFRYAKEFVLCDNYFGEAKASSYPNYFLLMAARTPTLEHLRDKPVGKYDIPTIADRLTDKGIPWRNYDGGIALLSMFKKPYESGNIVPVKQFDMDAKNGTLPPVSWITPSLKNSEHPPHSVKAGERWTVDRINAVMRGPQWSSCALFVIWDEWGGFDDHVTPPTAEDESLFSPAARYGYRIPCLVISPYAKRGHVSHTFYSHSSVLRTIEELFDVEPLTKWDANATSLLDCFDFARQPGEPLVL